MRILLDAGHGCKDSGAVYGSVKEKDINLKFVLLLRDFLKDYEGVEIVMTREDDCSAYTAGSDFIKRFSGLRQSTKSLYARAWLVNVQKVHLVLSVHCNAALSSSARGTEAFVFSKASEAYPLAIKLVDEVSEWLGAKRSVREAGFVILKKTVAPAVLLELGFLTNPTDRKKLTDEAWLVEAAKRVAGVIAAHYGLKKKKPEPRVWWRVIAKTGVYTSEESARKAAAVIEDALKKVASVYYVSVKRESG